MWVFQSKCLLLRHYKILFTIFFAYGVFVNTLTLEKSPTAAIILAVVVFYYLRKNKIAFRYMLLSIVGVFIIPLVIMYFLLMDHENIFRVLSITLLNRIFIVPTEVTYYYFKIFPDTHDFLFGQSSHLFSWLYSDGVFPIANYVAKIWWRNPWTTGSANTLFIGNFWADFGWTGVILSIFCVGLILHLFYYKLVKVCAGSKNIIFVSFTSILVPIFTFNFFSSNFTILLFSRGLFIIIICLFVLDRVIKKDQDNN